MTCKKCDHNNSNIQRRREVQKLKASSLRLGEDPKNLKYPLFWVFFLILWAFRFWQNWAWSESFPGRSSSPGDDSLSTRSLALPCPTWTPSSSGPAGCSLMSSSLWCSTSMWRGFWQGVQASDGCHHIALKWVRTFNPFYHSPAAIKLPMDQQVEGNVPVKGTGPSSRVLPGHVPSSLDYTVVPTLSNWSTRAAPCIWGKC